MRPCRRCYMAHLREPKPIHKPKTSLRSHHLTASHLCQVKGCHHLSRRMTVCCRSHEREDWLLTGLVICSPLLSLTHLWIGADKATMSLPNSLEGRLLCTGESIKADWDSSAASAHSKAIPTFPPWQRHSTQQMVLLVAGCVRSVHCAPQQADPSCH